MDQLSIPTFNMVLCMLPITTSPGDMIDDLKHCSLYNTSKYTRRDAVQQKAPFARIRLLDAVQQSKRRLFAAVWTQPGVVCSEKVTFDPLTRQPVDLFEKEPLKGNSVVHLHTPTKFGEDPSKDLGGDREQTNKQTNKRCSNYSMMYLLCYQPKRPKAKRPRVKTSHARMGKLGCFDFRTF